MSAEVGHDLCVIIVVVQCEAIVDIERAVVVGQEGVFVPLLIGFARCSRLLCDVTC